MQQYLRTRESHPYGLPLGVVRLVTLCRKASVFIMFSRKVSQMFTPNNLSFWDGIGRIKKALTQVGGNNTGEIITSRYAGAEKLLDLLKVDNIPDGFTKYQLPVFMEGIPGV